MRALLARAGAADCDPARFEVAFVHESAVREELAPQSNDRLEFLGDALLGFVVTRSLYERFPDADAGELTLRKHALVADAVLIETAKRLGFSELLVLGAGLAKAAPSARRSALADTFEAFLAVLHRECGLPAVEAFITREHIAPRERLGLSLDDPKSLLQEWTQRRFASVPSYSDRFEGPDHERTFFAEVTVPGEVSASGSGNSKKAAERAAAARAVALLSERYDDIAPPERSKAVAPARARGVQTRRRTASNESNS